MKGCSAGTRAKGRVGGGGKEKEDEGDRRGYKSSAPGGRGIGSMVTGVTPRGGGGHTGPIGLGQCQGSLAKMIGISLFGDKTAIPLSPLSDS